MSRHQSLRRQQSDPAAEDEGFEQDPDKILEFLSRLPAFPENPEEINKTLEPAFAVSGGPCVLIREVLVPPLRSEECPIEIYDLLEEARILQNAGQNEGAVKRLLLALNYFKDSGLWPDISKGLDPIEERKKREERRKQELERILEERRLAQEKEEEERKKAEEEAAAEEEERKQQSSPNPHSNHSTHAKISTHEKPTKEDKVEEAKDKDEHEASAKDKNDQEDDDEDEDASNPLPLEVQMEFELYVWNSIGSCFQSMRKDLQAMVYYWNAKQTHDAFLIGVEEESHDRMKKTASLVELQQLVRNSSSGVQDGGFDSVAQLRPLENCSPGTATTYSNLGSTAHHMGLYDLSLNCFYNALQIRFQSIPEESDEYVDVASTLNNVGVALSALHRYKEAYAYFVSAEELMLERLDSVHPRLNVMRINLEKIQQRRTNINMEAFAAVDPTKNKVELRKWYVNFDEFNAMVAKYGPFKKTKTKGKKKKKK